jgi:hypothetical protein
MACWKVNFSAKRMGLGIVDLNPCPVRKACGLHVSIGGKGRSEEYIHRWPAQFQVWQAYTPGKSIRGEIVEPVIFSSKVNVHYAPRGYSPSDHRAVSKIKKAQGRLVQPALAQDCPTSAARKFCMIKLLDFR